MRERERELGYTGYIVGVIYRLHCESAPCGLKKSWEDT